MFASDLANPGSDSQSNSGLRKIVRKVSLEFANFDWTRHNGGYPCVIRLDVSFLSVTKPKNSLVIIGHEAGLTAVRI